MKTTQNFFEGLDLSGTDFYEQMIEENERRRLDKSGGLYDPSAGIGAFGDRVPVDVPATAGRTVWVPRAMTRDPEFEAVAGSEIAFNRLRMKYDFEFWAVTAATIKEKTGFRMVPFVLNRPQRRVFGLLEGDRLAGRPVRMIMLKARQWGGSTLVQMYMAWIQLCVHPNWNVAVCAQHKDTASVIRGMYSGLFERYPEEYGPDGKRPVFRPFEKSANISEIVGRGGKVTIGSSERHDAFRGSDIAMAHLSETAYWPSSPLRNPEDAIRSIAGSVPEIADTLLVIESTANGVGNFFHKEWVRATTGCSDKRPVFVPWHEIEMYSAEVDDYTSLIDSMDEYERRLWDEHGCTLQQIAWFRKKRAGFPDLDSMLAEFPTTPEEAFVATGSNVFGTKAVEALREGCDTIEPRVGELSGDGRFVGDSATGRLTMWRLPEARADYVVTVDVGGRSRQSDWSVIAVMRNDGKPEVVAQWRGHIDHDLLADKAVEIARFYNNALLVIESNSLESENDDIAANSVLERVERHYTRLYRRYSTDGEGSNVGFHTNRRTKPMVIDALVRAVREGTYIERDHGALNEMLTYCLMPNGAYAARSGHHDDILMTRAITLHLMERGLPGRIDPDQFRRLTRRRS